MKRLLILAIFIIVASWPVSAQMDEDITIPTPIPASYGRLVQVFNADRKDVRELWFEDADGTIRVVYIELHRGRKGLISGRTKHSAEVEKVGYVFPRR